MSVHTADRRVLYFCLGIAAVIAAMFLQSPVIEPTEWVGTNPLPGLPSS